MSTSTSSSALAAASRILVVDDISKNLQVIGSMLRNEGYHVMPATSGPQALERIRAQAPDLILLDLMMPEMDGLEVCRRLKADPAFAQIPVIFLTASNEMEHLVNAFAAGAVDYITKPFNAPELLARVRTHVELQHARARLREMNDEKNEFMGIVAHDLRNPLNCIQGYSELILEESAEARVQEPAQRILDTSRRMTEMVRNLLDANRIERGEMKLDLQPIPFSAVLGTVVESYQPRAAAKQQVIGLECKVPAAADLTILADRSLLLQVLENLISNAVKYSPVGTRIDVVLTRASDVGRCEVRDHGPGLSADDQKKLFGKFARLSAKPTGGEHATGLGLSIVKKMVEAMNGKVWCESQLGQGASFFVQFPLQSHPSSPT